MKKVTITACIWIILVLFSSDVLLAQEASQDPVDFQINEVPVKVEDGMIFTITVDAYIDNKWRLYSIRNNLVKGPLPMQFIIETRGLELAGQIKESNPAVSYDPGFDTELAFHSRRAAFYIPLRFSPGAEGQKQIEIGIIYQAGSDNGYHPPKIKKLRYSILVEAMGNGYATHYSIDKASELKVLGNPVALSGFGELMSFLWIALAAGFATLLPPFVFPMILLTVSYFSKQVKKAVHWDNPNLISVSGNVVRQQSGYVEKEKFNDF